MLQATLGLCGFNLRFRGIFMTEEKSSFQWSRLLWILGWPATWLAIYIYYSCLQNLDSFFSSIFASLVYPLFWAVLIFLGFQIAGSILLVKSADPKATFVKLTGAMLCGVYGFVICYLYYMAVPGYIVPFINDMTGRWVMLGLILWQSVGVVVLFKVQKFWAWLATVVCFSLPLALVMRIGPLVLWRNSSSTEAQFLDTMARSHFAELFRLDGYFIAAFVVLACVTFPGIWMKLIHLKRKPTVASEA
jgi:hypothetical protein